MNYSRVTYFDTLDNAQDHKEKLKRARQNYIAYNDEIDEKGYQAYLNDMNEQRKRIETVSLLF